MYTEHSHTKYSLRVLSMWRETKTRLSSRSYSSVVFARQAALLLSDINAITTIKHHLRPYNFCQTENAVEVTKSRHKNLKIGSVSCNLKNVSVSVESKAQSILCFFYVYAYSQTCSLSKNSLFEVYMNEDSRHMHSRKLYLCPATAQFFSISYE